jgi:hypothetical protein
MGFFFRGGGGGGGGGGLTRVFLCIHIVYLEAHCAFFDIYNITINK